MIDVRKAVEEITPEITAMRNHIHENPELSMKEYNTCALLEEYVKKNVAYDRLKRVGETGLFFEIKGTKPGPGRTIVFRGDIDALPIQEDPSMSPCSKVPGVMHACGHDIHGTINVGAASILSKCKDQFSGSLYFFIQPAEEILQGAKLFLNDPEIDFDKIDAITALHCSPEIEAGTIGVRYGAILASADEFHITVNGVGGHGAHCHTVRDPIVAASAIVTGLQTLVSRETNPANAVVVSVCTIHGGRAHNIVPDKVEITGTVRTLNAADRDRAEESLKRVAASIAERYGVGYRRCGVHPGRAPLRLRGRVGGPGYPGGGEDAGQGKCGDDALRRHGRRGLRLHQGEEAGRLYPSGFPHPRRPLRLRPFSHLLQRPQEHPHRYAHHHRHGRRFPGV